MSLLIIVQVAACAGLVAIAIVPFASRMPRSVAGAFVGAIVLLCVAAAYLSVYRGGVWHTGFSASLWLTVVTSLIVFAAAAAAHPPMRRLAMPLAAYLALLAILALIWSGGQSGEMAPGRWSAWLGIHVLVSVLTFALVTLSAVAGVAMLVQARALKRKRTGAFAAALPSVSECERMEMRLLLTAEALLLAGVVTGLAQGAASGAGVLRFDHKTVLSLVGFAAIGLLLLVYHFAGMRGKLATRLVLVAYLVLALAYPGVKFVTDILLQRPA